MVGAKFSSLEARNWWARRNRSSFAAKITSNAAAIGFRKAKNSRPRANFAANPGEFSFIVTNFGSEEADLSSSRAKFSSSLAKISSVAAKKWEFFTHLPWAERGATIGQLVEIVGNEVADVGGAVGAPTLKA